MNKRSGFSFSDLLFVIVAAIVLSTVVLAAIGTPNGVKKDYGSGTICGVVTRIDEDQGLILKSTECTMVVAMPNSVSGIMNLESFQFSVFSTNVLEKLRSSLLEGRRIELGYDQYFIRPFRAGTPYIATRVN